MTAKEQGLPGTPAWMAEVLRGAASHIELRADGLPPYTGHLRSIATYIESALASDTGGRGVVESEIRAFLQRSKVPGKTYLYCMKPSEIDNTFAALRAQPAGGGVSPPVDCIGLALDLEQQAGRVESQTVERSMTGAAIGLRRIDAALTQPQPEKAMNEHTDDSAIDRFAAAMKAKMAKQREKGYGDWDNPAACPAERLEQCLRESVLKGDPVDVGNFAMMLFNRGESTQGSQPPTALDLKRANCLHDWATDGMGDYCRHCGRREHSTISAENTITYGYGKFERPPEFSEPEMTAEERQAAYTRLTAELLAATTPPESGGQGDYAAMIERHQLRADECPGQSMVVLASSMRRLLATHPPAQASGAVTEAMVLAACRAHDPMYESCGSDTRADMRADIRRALEAALAQGGGNER